MAKVTLMDKAYKVYNKIVAKPAVKAFSKRYDRYWSVVSGEKTDAARQRLSGVVSNIKAKQKPNQRTLLGKTPSKAPLRHYKSYRDSVKNLAKAELQRAGYIGGTAGTAVVGVHGYRELTGDEDYIKTKIRKI